MSNNENVKAIRFDFKDKKQFDCFWRLVESNFPVLGVYGIITAERETYNTIKLIINKEDEKK